MNDVLKYVIAELATIDITLERGTPNFSKTQEDEQIFVANYELVNSTSNICGTVDYEYNLLIKGVTATTSRSNITEYNLQQSLVHENLVMIGDYLKNLTLQGSVTASLNRRITSFKSYNLKDLGTDVSGRYVIELRIPVLWSSSIQ